MDRDNISESHKTGELPLPGREAYNGSADVLRLAMRIAIPLEDWGSRGAVTYAVEIAEALAYLQVKLEPMPNFSEELISREKAFLDENDKPEIT